VISDTPRFPRRMHTNIGDAQIRHFPASVKPGEEESKSGEGDDAKTIHPPVHGAVTIVKEGVCLTPPSPKLRASVVGPELGVRQCAEDHQSKREGMMSRLEKKGHHH
jgi:hypothetical protein